MYLKYDLLESDLDPETSNWNGSIAENDAVNGYRICRSHCIDLLATYWNSGYSVRAPMKGDFMPPPIALDTTPLFNSTIVS